ncbi:MAG: hypothetical protein IJX18_01665 [Clostridia bacterium]|nr:hypothetical protein [Clostridia bacterium]
MILYLSIIGVCWLVLSGVISLALWQPFWQVLLWAGLSILIVLIIDALTATVARLLPPPKDGKFFEVSQKEKNRYEKWHIRKWKDRVPEIGQFTGFRKNKLDDPKSAAYLERFLLESRYGEIGHLASCVTGALIFLPQLIPVFPFYWWIACAAVFVVNVLLNLPSYFILRYNYYKLKILHKSVLKKEQKQAQQLSA